ncbi:hypothetical protein GGR51DRAFT_499584 [Nemania sp. FL0031]|nr:hypothetical protein GGR51DRAFT_499584 [Nemania sp. FL0031]
MEFVQGRRLEDVWFGLDMADGVRKQAVLTKRREAILRNVAGAMLQLGRYEFERGGAPCFDRVDGELVGAGPLRELDVQAMVDRWFLDEDCDTAPVYRGVGPWEDTGGMYTAWLDAYPPANESEKGVDELLRLLLKHVREPTSCRPQSGFPSSPPSGPSRKGSRMGRTQAAKEEPKTTKTNVKKFVLTHSDLSMRHILLAEDGTTIKAILGWDCAQAAPRSLGNEALPRWLARDFDPFVWAWRPPPDVCRVGHIPPECNRFEDPPWVLRELRGYYTRIIRELKLEGNGTQRGMDTTQGGYASNAGDGNREGFDADVDVDVDVDITKQSLLTLTLDAAIRDPRRRTAALRRLLEKCSRSFEELDFGFFIDNLGNGYEIDSMRLRCLANNVRELVDKGFVKGARGVL